MFTHEGSMCICVLYMHLCVPTDTHMRVSLYVCVHVYTIDT
jgi:hypothetical protein